MKNPPSEYRGMPFWSLNDRLEPAEMIRQVEEFHRAGMGGFFLHSRTGQNKGQNPTLSSKIKVQNPTLSTTEHKENETH
jgi:hypothetical protein